MESNAALKKLGGQKITVGKFTATEPGAWMLHCHIPHHITNDGVEPGGLMLVVNVSE